MRCSYAFKRIRVFCFAICFPPSPIFTTRLAPRKFPTPFTWQSVRACRNLSHPRRRMWPFRRYSPVFSLSSNTFYIVLNLQYFCNTFCKFTKSFSKSKETKENSLVSFVYSSIFSFEVE